MLSVEYKGTGDVHAPVNLYVAAWDECLEMQVMDKQAWVHSALTTVQAHDRIEVLQYVQDLCVGGVVLVPEQNDLHVGHCMSVLFQYVLPAYRNTGLSTRFMRAARRCTRTAGAPVLAYTHRVGVGKYLTTYRRV